MELLQKKLLASYLLEHQKLLQRFGMSSPINEQSAGHYMAEHLEKAAVIATEWDITAETYMGAAFRRAIRDGYPDGPFPKLLGSKRYMLAALSQYTGAPSAVITGRNLTTSKIKELNDGYMDAFHQMESVRLASGIDHVVFLTSVPAYYRMIYFGVGYPEMTAKLYPETVMAADADEYVAAWLAQAGCSRKRLDVIKTLYNQYINASRRT
jgi:hypothetical protein